MTFRMKAFLLAGGIISMSERTWGKLKPNLCLLVCLFDVKRIGYLNSDCRKIEDYTISIYFPSAQFSSTIF